MNGRSLDRFWARVNKTDSCWLWTGSTVRGYGVFTAPGHESSRAHRVAYEHFVGEIPAGHCVCHRCDTPACVNPEHLFAATQLDNIADRHAKGRTSKGASHSEKLRAKPRPRRHAPYKLTEVDIREMFELRKGGMVLSEIAARFNCAPTMVSAVMRRKVWAHLDCGPTPERPSTKGARHCQAKLSERDVREILVQRGAESATALGQRFGVTANHIRYIWRGKTWGHLTESAA